MRVLYDGYGYFNGTDFKIKPFKRLKAIECKLTIPDIVCLESFESVVITQLYALNISNLDQPPQPILFDIVNVSGFEDTIEIDNYREICESYSSDNRIKIIRNSHKSTTQSKNDDVPNNEIIHKPEYLNTNHPTYSVELAAAIETWDTVLKNNPPKPNRGSRKTLIEKHLKDRYSHFSTSAIDRITGILNPDKTGGTPKSEINLPNP